MKWVLALDEHCGPTLPDVTFTSGRPLVSIPSYASSESDIFYNQDFFSIKHMSKFLLGSALQSVAQSGVSQSAAAQSAEAQQKSPTVAQNVSEKGAYSSGTVRVDTSVVSNGTTAAGRVILESFYHARSNLVTMIALNTDHTNSVPIQVTEGGMTFYDTLPAFSTKIYQWTK